MKFHKISYNFDFTLFPIRKQGQLVLIISQRNRRFAQFCKKLRLSHGLLSRKSRSKVCLTPSRVWNMKHETFFILEVMKMSRISRRNGFWLILERCGPFSGAEWIAEKSIYRSNFAAILFLSWICDVAVADAFCKNCAVVDFEKLWSKQVFMFSFNENGLYFTIKPCYFQFENDHNYEKTRTYKVRILSIWCEISATPYFHERSYEKMRTYKVRILNHLMRFYLKKG